MSECVNHPDHYKTGQYECIEVMKEIFGVDALKDFCKLNAFKYLWRADRKNGQEDLKKAKWYLDTLLLSELINPYDEGINGDCTRQWTVPDGIEKEPEEEDDGSSAYSWDAFNKAFDGFAEAIKKAAEVISDISDPDSEFSKRFARYKENLEEGYTEELSFYNAMKFDPDKEDDDEQHDA